MTAPKGRHHSCSLAPRVMLCLKETTPLCSLPRLGLTWKYAVERWAQMCCRCRGWAGG